MKRFWSSVAAGAAGLALATAVGPACHTSARHPVARPQGTPVHAVPGLEVLIFPPDPASQRAPEGYAIIQDRRQVDLQKGVSRLETQGVPRRLLDESVVLRSFTDPDGTKVRSQRFDFDTQDVWAVLDRHVGGDLIVRTDAGELRGKLVAFDAAAITIDTGAAGGDRYKVVPLADAVDTIQLADHAGGWLVSPTLEWELEARRAGPQLVEILYETGGIHWWAHHVVTLRGGDADLTSWATVDNQSGKSFERASVKLVEADGRMTRSPYGGDGYGVEYDEYGNYIGDAEEGGVANPPAITAGLPAGAAQGGDAYGQPGDEHFHVYAVAGSPTLADGGETQLSLAHADGAKAWIEHRYEPVSARIINSTGLNRIPMYAIQQAPIHDAARILVVDRPKGSDLPAGTVHVFRADADGDPVLVANGVTTHVDAGEPLRVVLGGSDEIYGNRTRVKLFQDARDARRRRLRESFEIEVKNRGTETARVSVIEHLYRGKKWEIRSESVTHQPVGPQTVSFPVTVAPGKSAKVTYEVEYLW